MKKPDRGRKRLHIPAYIMVGGKPHDCLIFDLSSGGARLTIKHQMKLPDRFSVDMSQDGRVIKKCELVWQDELTAGVRFL